jgi:putative ABC transport system substrate-binding protein
VLRRKFLKLLAGAASLPFAAHGQQGEQVRRIGLLMLIAENDPQGRADRTAFEKSLIALGWAPGKNIHLEYRWAGGDPVRLSAFAAELIEMKPDVIVTEGTPALAAAKRTTQTIPIIFANVTDPVGQGYVVNLAKPGGNATGFTLFEFSIGTKWVQLLREIVPTIKEAGFLFNPAMAPYSNLYFRSVQVAAETHGIRAFPIPVNGEADIERELTALGQRSDTGLIVLQDAFTATHRSFLTARVAHFKVPAVFAVRFYAESGGMISYGVNFADQYRQAAIYVDRVLKGATPGDLPVQQPTKFELVINLKTAKVIGIEIPMSLLLRADEVIE